MLRDEGWSGEVQSLAYTVAHQFGLREGRTPERDRLLAHYLRILYVQGGVDYVAMGDLLVAIQQELARDERKTYARYIRALAERALPTIEQRNGGLEWEAREAADVHQEDIVFERALAINRREYADVRRTIAAMRRLD